MSIDALNFGNLIHLPIMNNIQLFQAFAKTPKMYCIIVNSIKTVENPGSEQYSVID